ncbi:MAG: CAP domain-containing protein [Deltaproteobacteria bacterium]|nr:CAP domain-containing protein [Deltaproteobacteria bacterium]
MALRPRHARPTCLLGLSLLLVACDPGPTATRPSGWSGRRADRDDDGPPIGSAAVLERPLAGLAPQAVGCGGTAPTSTHPAFEQELVERVNRERALQGLPPLARNARLDEAARYHTADMAADVYFNHDTYDRIGGALTRVCGFGDRVTSFYPSWGWLGENLALGQATPADAIAAWMGSAGHRGNILHANYWEIGVGYSAGNYWAQDFGTPGGSSSTRVVVNGEAASTTDPNVTLYVYGTWTQMRVRNNDGAWSAWVPFANSSTWRLPNLRATHRVTVEVQQASTVASDDDTIFLDVPGPNLPHKLYLPIIMRL